ncbi:MAG TPA: glycoside hydrolase family 16 protein [Terriglobales bacterium]|nr:glycoside hydrolase family 16 protein [Terriglobales bacterium]
MKSYAIVALAVAVLALPLAAHGQSGCVGVSPITIGSTNYAPQWCQEFNGAVGSPDNSQWKFDLGNNNGWGNHEVEVYCGPPGYPGNPAQCPSTFSTAKNTVYLDGKGHLVIQPLNVDGTWLSTRMLTAGRQDFRYGLIKASLRLPDTTKQGLWPAFWSLGSDIGKNPWPACGEADIMEDWSPEIFNGPGARGNRSTIHTTKTGGPGLGAPFTFPAGPRADTAFHTYGTIWSANMMEFFVDDPATPFFIATPDDLPSGDAWPFNSDAFLLLNVAVGGTLGGSSAALTNPQPLMADYIRWYTIPANAAGPKPILGSPSAITVRAGASANITLKPKFAPGTGFFYFSCSTDAPGATCEIATNNPLNRHVVSSRAVESVTASVSTSKGKTPSGNYSVNVYAFGESNYSDGSKSHADASVVIPLAVRE